MPTHYFAHSSGLPLCWEGHVQNDVIQTTQDRDKVTCNDCLFDLSQGKQ